MDSQFRAHTLAEIFSDLYHAEQSGVLILKRGNTEKRVHFDRGIIAFAESPLEDDDLGRVLVSQGRLSEGALAEAVGSINDSAGAIELAQVLINRDLIQKSCVARAMTTIIDRVVRSVFSWEDGQAGFTECPRNGALFGTDILTTVEVILNGIRCMAGFDPIQDAMKGLENRLRMRDPTPIPLERLTLSATHGFILSRIDGQSSLGDIISILPPDEEELAVRFVFGLLVMGVLEYDPPLGEGGFRVGDVVRDHEDRRALERLQEHAIQEQYGRVRGQNLYEVLGITPGASRDDIVRAYEGLKLQFGRDRVLPRVRDKFRSQLDLIGSRMIEAYLTLTQPDRRSSRPDDEDSNPPDDVAVSDLAVRVEIDRAKSKVEIDNANRVADSYFAKGRKCLRDGDYHNAIQYGKLAISHNRSDARYFCLVAEGQSRNPEHRWQRMAEENYAKATRLDPWNWLYWVCLGRLYKKRGMKLRARKQFEEALKLVPNKSEVVKELTGLD